MRWVTVLVLAGCGAGSSAVDASPTILEVQLDAMAVGQASAQFAKLEAAMANSDGVAGLQALEVMIGADANVVFPATAFGLPPQAAGQQNDWNPTGCTINITSGPEVRTTYYTLGGTISTDSHTLAFDMYGATNNPDGTSTGLYVKGTLAVGAAIDGTLELQLHSPTEKWGLTFVYAMLVLGTGPCAASGTFEATALFGNGSGRHGTLDASKICVPN